MTKSVPFTQDELTRVRRSDQAGNLIGIASKLLANLDQSDAQLQVTLTLIRQFTSSTSEFQVVTIDKTTGDFWCYVCDASCSKEGASTEGGGLRHDEGCPVPTMMRLTQEVNNEVAAGAPVDSTGSRYMNHAG